jgi:hypothetical protein
MTPKLFHLRERHLDFLRVVAGNTELSQAEILRRIIDRSSVPDVVNDLIPCMSGRILTEIGGGK